MDQGSAKLPEIDPNFKPHWRTDLSNEEYHSDRTAVSSTGVKKMKDSPWSFYSYHTSPQDDCEEKKHLRIGTAVHMAILEPELFKKRFVISPKFSGTGMMKAKADWRLELAPDAVILTQDEYNDLQEMINSTLRHTSACMVLKEGMAEVSGYFSDPVTDIKSRIRPDFFNDKLMALVDVKTTRHKIDHKSFSRTIAELEYHVQMAMYCEGARLITGKEVKFPIFFAIQTKAPFECALYIADEVMLERGCLKYHNYMRKIKACLETNNWPSFQKSAKEISLPAWALMDEED